MSLSGLMGFLPNGCATTGPRHAAHVAAIPAGVSVAAATGLSLLGTTAEAGLLHFRGAFHNPAMLLPVTMPPVAAGLLANAAIGRGVRRHFGPEAWWLAATTVMGVAGVAFHAYGVSRNMGGWRNWRQNAFAGPPLPAPPSFTGLALAGLAALGAAEGTCP
jgi:hypothetical protein